MHISPSIIIILVAMIVMWFNGEFVAEIREKDKYEIHILKLMYVLVVPYLTGVLYGAMRF